MEFTKPTKIKAIAEDFMITSQFCTEEPRNAIREPFSG